MFLVLLSCKKDGQNDDAVADVYVKSILADGNLFLALYTMWWVCTDDAVTVNPPGGMMEPLNAYSTTKRYIILNLLQRWEHIHYSTRTRDL